MLRQPCSHSYGTAVSSGPDMQQLLPCNTWPGYGDTPAVSTGQQPLTMSGKQIQLPLFSENVGLFRNFSATTVNFFFLQMDGPKSPGESIKSTKGIVRGESVEAITRALPENSSPVPAKDNEVSVIVG